MSHSAPASPTHGVPPLPPKGRAAETANIPIEEPEQRTSFRWPDFSEPLLIRRPAIQSEIPHRVPAKNNNHSLTGVKKPNSFNGKFDSDPKNFLITYTLYARLLGWTDHESVHALGLFLTDRALTWYASLPASSLSSFERLKEVFLLKFGSAEKLKFSTLLRRDQKVGERIESYAADLEKFFANKSYDDSVQMDLFIAGLLPHFKEAVTLARPTTYEEAEQYALLKEQAISKINTINSMQDTEMKSLLNEVTALREQSKESAHLIQEINSLRAKVNQLTSQKAPRQQCDFCRKKGHNEQECYAKRDFLASRNGLGNQGYRPQTFKNSNTNFGNHRFPNNYQRFTNKATYNYRNNSSNNPFHSQNPFSQRPSNNPFRGRNNTNTQNYFDRNNPFARSNNNSGINTLEPKNLTENCAIRGPSLNVLLSDETFDENCSFGEFDTVTTENFEEQHTFDKSFDLNTSLLDDFLFLDLTPRSSPCPPPDPPQAEVLTCLPPPQSFSIPFILGGKGPTISIPISINDQNLFALLDSGASLSCLDQQIFQLLDPTTYSEIVPKVNAIMVADGTAIDIKKAITTKIKIADSLLSVEFVILPKINQTVILGKDFLYKHGMVLDFQNECLNYKTQTQFLNHAEQSQDNLFRTELDYEPFTANYQLQTDFEYKHEKLEDYIQQFLNALRLELSINLDKTNTETLINFIQSHISNFAFPDTQLGARNIPPTRIFTEDTPPIFQRPYRTSPAQAKQINAHVEHLLQQGLIRPSRSDWASPCLLTDKKNGRTRFCIDYRRLNKVTKRDNFPLPVIDDYLTKFHGSRIFSTLDLTSGYHQLPIDRQDQHKTAFITSSGLFEFTCLPFGLRNAPSIFQRAMLKCFDSNPPPFVLIYLDDVIIHSASFEEHITHLAYVMAIFESKNLKLNPEKCHFANTEISFLGHIVSDKGISTDPEKVRAVAELSHAKE